MNLKDKRALAIGDGSGIGFAAEKALAEVSVDQPLHQSLSLKSWSNAEHGL
jgi:hypothetical protein